MKAIILAGGVGKRLWPMSTEEKPKQFQKLVSNKTMLQETYERISYLKDENIYISTNEVYKDIVQEQLPSIPKSNIIPEPCRRETAPCIGLVTALIAKKDPNSIISIIYADQLIQNTKEFQNSLKTARDIIEKENKVCIVEVPAISPNTNLGYVKVNDEKEIVNNREILGFEKFTEKPNYEDAIKFVKSGQYYWNTGLYIYKAQHMMDLFEKHLPDTHKVLIQMQNNPEKISSLYEKCEKISIDYGIMEQLSKKDVKIIPANLNWSDIGTWQTLKEELIGDDNNNVLRGNIKSKDTQDCLAYMPKDKEVIIVGCNNLIVVEEDNKLIVCQKNKSHLIKEILN